MEYIAYLHKDKKFGLRRQLSPTFPAASPPVPRWKRHAAWQPRLWRSMWPECARTERQFPRPSTLDDLRGDPAMKGAVAFLTELREPERTVRINITARQSQIAEIDRRARAKGLYPLLVHRAKRVEKKAVSR
jgi:hypothetical protein